VTLSDLLDDRTLDGLAPSARPEAHVQWAQWLADLGTLRNAASSAPSEDTDASASPADFQARYAAALQERGINTRTLKRSTTQSRRYSWAADASIST
jgi:hypothetical protein